MAKELRMRIVACGDCPWRAMMYRSSHSTFHTCLEPRFVSEYDECGSIIGPTVKAGEVHERCPLSELAESD